MVIGTTSSAHTPRRSNHPTYLYAGPKTRGDRQRPSRELITKSRVTMSRLDMKPIEVRYLYIVLGPFEHRDKHPRCSICNDNGSIGASDKRELGGPIESTAAITEVHRDAKK